jgi:hypothetical protein
METATVFSEEEQEMLKQGLKALKESGVNHGEQKADTVTGCQEKLNKVEEMSQGGYCYLKLMATMPGFKVCDLKRVEHMASAFKAALGPEPNSLKVIGLISTVSIGLLSHEPPVLVDALVDFEEARTHVKELGHLMKSSARYTYEDIGGVYHIKGPNRSFCSCEDVLCDHGWAARFILSLLTTDVKVGASLDFNAIFADNEPAEDTILQPAGRRPVSGGWLESLKEQNSSDDQEQESESEPERAILDDFIRTLKGSPIRMPVVASRPTSENGSATPKQQPSRRSDRRPQAPTILPEDSSTQIGRYADKRPGRYMNDGSVFTVTRRGSGLERLDTERVLSLERQVVQGFLKTQRMAKEEEEVNKSVYTINGLANPFRNNRLNFLCHFHTACEVFNGLKDETPFNIIQNIYDMNAKTPTEELMRQVVCKTFDMDRLVVVANPFKLPHVEVGMLLTDRTVAICFDLLRSEYKTLWFNEVKSLSIPSFHSEYSSLRSNVLTGSHRGDVTQQRHGPRSRGRSRGSRPEIRKKAKSIFTVG